MARLTSLASVLAILEAAGDGARPPSGDREQDGSLVTGAPQSAQASVRTGPLGPPGYEIYQNARKQARFFAAYAEMLEPDRRSRSARRPLLGRRRDGGDAWVREVYPEGHWVGPATLATAYRQAAQFAALVDVGWATKLAIRAAMAYVSSGLPFGVFLAAGLLGDAALDDDDVRQAVVAPFQSPDAADAIGHPVQQAYLLLAANSRPWLRDLLSQPLLGIEQRLRAHGLYAIGPQRVPLGEYLDLATSMSRDDVSAGLGHADSSANEIAGRLARLQRTQANGLRAARRNQYLWQSGDGIIDLENVALSGVALRHRPWFGELSEAIADLVRDDELAELPVWTMGQVETELPEIASSVTEILLEPEQAWRREEFLEPETATDPWTEEARTRETERRPEAPTRPDYPPARRDDASPAARPVVRPGPQSSGSLGDDLGYYPDEPITEYPDWGTIGVPDEGTDDDLDDGDEGDNGGPYLADS